MRLTCGVHMSMLIFFVWTTPQQHYNFLDLLESSRSKKIFYIIVQRRQCYSTKCNWFSYYTLYSISTFTSISGQEWSCLFYFRLPWFFQLASICLLEMRMAVSRKSRLRNFKLESRKGWKIATKSQGVEIFSACIIL